MWSASIFTQFGKCFAIFSPIVLFPLPAGPVKTNAKLFMTSLILTKEPGIGSKLETMVKNFVWYIHGAHLQNLLKLFD